MNKIARATIVAFSFAAATQLNLAAQANTPTVNHNWTPVHTLPHMTRGSVAIGTVPKVHPLQTSQIQHSLISG
jgi:hypothetical protein